MIILLGQHSDSVIRHFASFLKRRKRTFIFINQSRLGKDVIFASNNWWLAGECLEDRVVKGVFNRWILEDEMLSKHHKQLLNSLNYRWPNVFNRPTAHQSNTSKLYQVGVMHKMGLKIPESIVACGKHPKLKTSDWIYKSISGVRSIVKLVKKDACSVIPEPVLFQRYIKGLNIRVHVTPKATVGIGIKSNDVDYRYSSGVKAVAVDLPETITENCQNLRQYFGLMFCGIDIIYHQSEYYFLEVNPMPAYRYFEVLSGDEAVSEAIYEEFFDDINDS